jgi:hypothetical protein
MRLLDQLSIRHGNYCSEIELLEGDLTALPLQQAVDVLVVSAFQGDYSPTPSSLIGALDRIGLSVDALARDKQIDLRAQFSCWLSKPLPRAFPYRHVLCIESGWIGSPVEIVDDLFRTLAPYLLSILPNSSVAMPLIGTGDQQADQTRMLNSILGKAVNWIQRGLKLKTLKIVVREANAVRMSREIFAAFKAKFEGSDNLTMPAQEQIYAYDVFVSYARAEIELANFVVDRLRAAASSLRIYIDQVNMREGLMWPMQLAHALDSSRRVVALYSPSYWASRYCQNEFLAALARQHDTNADILFPLYLIDANIPYMFNILQRIDCRIAERSKIAQACERLVSLPA